MSGSERLRTINKKEIHISFWNKLLFFLYKRSENIWPFLFGICAKIDLFPEMFWLFSLEMKWSICSDSQTDLWQPHSDFSYSLKNVEVKLKKKLTLRPKLTVFSISPSSPFEDIRDKNHSSSGMACRHRKSFFSFRHAARVLFSSFLPPLSSIFSLRKVNSAGSRVDMSPEAIICHGELIHPVLMHSLPLTPVESDARPVNRPRVCA